MNVLVAGGAGYIGSHTVIRLLQQGHKVTVIDNLSNSSKSVIKRIEKITGEELKFIKLDLCNYDELSSIENEKWDAIMHFAALKSVSESVENPIAYYLNNVLTTINLCRLSEKLNIEKIVFSSSATVYGYPESVPIKEMHNLSSTNPYGETKIISERILQDFAKSNQKSVSLLRYFNPIGAHKSAEIGEDPSGIPSNLLPFISQIAVGRHSKLKIFGNDYNTIDGTGVRDYIHVVDLANAHIASLEKMPDPGHAEAYNIGTGRGYSVLEVIKAFETASGIKIPFEFKERRQGDVGSCYADVSKAKSELNWVAKYTLEEACRDAWNWQSRNPSGF